MKLLPVILVVAVLPLGAQTVTDAELFNNGKTAFDARIYYDAIAYLYAYISRNPEAMQTNPNHAAQVQKAYAYARDDIVQTISRVSRLEQQLETQRASSGVGSTSRGMTLAPPPLDNPTATTTRSYPLICRGGGGLTFSLQPGANGVQGSTIVVGFKRAAASSADGSGLAPGECSWLDRPVAPTEPDHFCQRADLYTFRMNWSTDGMTRNLSSTSAPYLENLIYADRFATVRVFNNFQGCLTVTDPGAAPIRRILKVRP